MINEFLKRTLSLILTTTLIGAGPLPALWAAEHAMLEGLEVGADEVTAYLSEKTEFRTFTLKEPPRIVIELKNTEHAAPSQYQDAEGAILSQVRSGQYQREPDLVTRIVLYLKKLAAYQARWDDTRLKIGLYAAPEAVPAAPAAAPPPPTAAPAPAETPHATLEEISVAGDKVTTRLSRKVEINSFVLTDPPRLIVDFSETLRGSTSRNIKGEGEILQRIRSSQFKTAPPVTRVVLFLKEAAAYSARWNGTDLEIALLTAPRAQTPPAPAPVAKAAPPALKEPETAVLDGLALSPDGLRASLSRKVKFNSFALAKPPRLVLEFSDTRQGSAPRQIKGSGGAVQRVRSAQYKRTPPITRVVMYLDEAAAYQAKWEDNDLTIGLLLPEKPKPEIAAVPDPEISAALEPQIDAAPEPQDAPEAAAEPEMRSAPKALPKPAAPVAARLQSIEAGEDSVTVTLTKKTEYETFVLTDPPRLVFEFMDTDTGDAPRKLDGKGKLLKKVRSSQYKIDPPVTRMVLNLEYPAGYRTRWEGTSLMVNLFGIQPEVKPEAETPPRPEDLAVVPEPLAAAPPAPKPVVVLAKNPKSKPVRLKDAAASKPAAAHAPQPPVDAHLPTDMSTQASPALEEMARSSDVEAEEGDDAAPTSKNKADAKSAAPIARRDIMATLPTDPTTLEFDAMDVRDILTLLATKAGINIVWGADVQGPLTLHLNDVPFNEAFTTILSMAGLVTNQVGENILRVMTPATLQTERKVAINQTRVISLRYSKAADVKPSIDAVRAAEGRSGSIVIDQKSNSLIITDTLDGIAGVERLLAKLDKRPQQVLIEAKLVEVQLSKNVSFGIQWDHIQRDLGEFGGSQGKTSIGATDPNAITTPLDQQAALTAGAGALGRGTGVNLPASSIFGAFTLGRVTNNYFLTATLTAAASEGKAKVLSDPKITTLNGEKAQIKITTSIPFVQTVTTQGAATTTEEKVEYQETGITLDVTPTINADGRIHLEIMPNVTQPSQTTASAGSTGAIATDTRTAQTKVLVRDGGTIVIGGLITDTVTDQVAKVPFFGDIPFIGWLFKKKFKDRRRVELLIFVTTKIVPS